MAHCPALLKTPTRHARPFVVVILLTIATLAMAETVTVSTGALVIVDGDTVRLDGQRLRLLDIDAPETHQAHCAAERKAGDRARLALAAMLDGQQVAIVYSGRIDPYGRPLVRLFVDGRDAGAALLAAGLALPYVPGRSAHAARTAHWCGK